MMRMMKMKTLMWRMGMKTKREMKGLTVEMIFLLYLRSPWPISINRTSAGLL